MNMEQIELHAEEGFWYYNTETGFHKHLILGMWDSSDNYRLITDLEKEEIERQQEENALEEGMLFQNELEEMI